MTAAGPGGGVELVRPGRRATAPVRRRLQGITIQLHLDEEIKTLNTQLEVLVRATAPDLVALHGVGVEIAGQFLVTVGDNPQRIHSEAAFANGSGG